MQPLLRSSGATAAALASLEAMMDLDSAKLYVPASSDDAVY